MLLDKIIIRVIIIIITTLLITKCLLRDRMQYLYGPPVVHGSPVENPRSTPTLAGWWVGLINPRTVPLK